MKFWTDKNKIALMIIFGIFTIGYFTTIIKASYAFVPSQNANGLYDLTIEMIKTASSEYAEDHESEFSDEDTLIIKVQDLIDSKLIIPNNDGKLKNPLNSEKDLNSKIITIKKNNDGFDVKIDK